jgi:hypothetical protein
MSIVLETLKFFSPFLSIFLLFYSMEQQQAINGWLMNVPTYNKDQHYSITKK